jgi:hypothetical protein
MENDEINSNDYYINNNLEKVNNFINDEIRLIDETQRKNIYNLEIYEKIIMVSRERKLDWCHYFNYYCVANKLCKKMKHQFEYLLYYCNKDTVEYVISIMMEVYHYRNKINNTNIDIDNPNYISKNKTYSEALKHLVYTDTPCNYNLEYPIRLYNIIELLPYRNNN